VCYDLRIASPLTLSEVRSMLPDGITADALPSTELTRFRALMPSAQTAAHLRVGACSCDLVRPRLANSREDERHLRARYRALGLPRDRIIRELERHRQRAPVIREPEGGWRAALASFVAEHARNAGPTLFRLGFHPGPDGPATADAPLRRTVSEIRAQPDRWLEEGRSTLVLRDPGLAPERALY
jgi:hypothetical protein